jgi:hypothetical protein
MQDWLEKDEEHSPTGEVVLKALTAYRYGVQNKEELLEEAASLISESRDPFEAMMFGDLMMEAGDHQVIGECLKRLTCVFKNN